MSLVLDALRPVVGWKRAVVALRAVLGAVVALAVPAHAQLGNPLGIPLPDPFTGVHVLTHRMDSARTGVNPNETILTPSVVRNGITTPSGQRLVFTKLFERRVDGEIHAQPLYVSNVPVTDTYTGLMMLRNVVYVCTANNTIYAFDADEAKGNFARPYWQRTFNFELVEIGPVPSFDIFPDYYDIYPVIGIVGTPVIDLQTQTMYVVVRSKELGVYYQRLYAIDIVTGRDRVPPVNIEARVEGTASEAEPDPNNPSVTYLTFDPRMHNQQAALLLHNGVIYIAWGSHAELPDYHGWVMAYRASDLQQLAVFCTTPDAQFDPDRSVGGGIGQSGSGLAADANGNVYAAIGLGTFDVDLEGRNYGMSVVKLRPNLTVADYFTPFNHTFLTDEGYDLSTGGVVLLPGSVGNAAHPNLAVAGGLEGRIYLLDRTDKQNPNEFRMGEFNIGFDAAVQTIRNAVGPIYGAPAYFNGRLYYNGAGDVLKQFAVSNARINPIAERRSPIRIGYPGASPVISANGTQNGIVWTLAPYYPAPVLPGGQEPAPYAVLYAHDANDVSQVLFNGLARGETDLAGQYVRHSVPVVANGKVFAVGSRRLAVYGLGPEPPARATRYQISGPVFIPAFFFLPDISEKTAYSFQITAIGPNQQPVPITTTVQLAMREPSGALRSLGTLRFNNQSSIVHTRIFPVASGLVELIVTDRNGTSSSAFVSIRGLAAEGQDRYRVRVASSVRVGQLVPVTVTAVARDGSPIPVFDIDTQENAFVPRQFAVLSTLPSGTQDLDFLAPGFVYDTDHPDPAGRAPELFFQSEVTILVRFKEVGQQVLIVTDGARTGTATVNVRP